MSLLIARMLSMISAAWLQLSFLFEFCLVLNEIITRVPAYKLASFQVGRSPLFEPGFAELLGRIHRAGHFTATGSAAEAVHHSELSFICVVRPPTT